MKLTSVNGRYWLECDHREWGALLGVVDVAVSNGHDVHGVGSELSSLDYIHDLAGRGRTAEIVRTGELVKADPPPSPDIESPAPPEPLPTLPVGRADGDPPPVVTGPGGRFRRGWPAPAPAEPGEQGDGLRLRRR